MTRLLLVRHAESTWNALGRWQGHADPPLSALGERHAALAASALGASVLDGLRRVVSSDLLRARRTAELIAAGLGVTAVEIRPALRERDVGAWSGLTGDEVDRAYPGYRSERRHPPGWEPDAQLLERVLPVLAGLAEESPDPAVVVTHGGVVHALERHLTGGTGLVQNLAGRWFVAEGGRISAGEAVWLLAGSGEPLPPVPSNR